MSGILYVVGTPIGNLSDFSPSKARKDGLHDNFGCYNFTYRKTTKFPVISYRSKWAAGWKSEWFYVKVNDDKEKLVQSPLELTFGETRPQCHMLPEGPTQKAMYEFKIIAENISTRDRKSTRLNSSHITRSRMPSSA